MGNQTKNRFKTLKEVKKIKIAKKQKNKSNAKFKVHKHKLKISNFINQHILQIYKYLKYRMKVDSK